MSTPELSLKEKIALRKAQQAKDAEPVGATGINPPDAAKPVVSVGKSTGPAATPTVPPSPAADSTSTPRPESGATTPSFTGLTIILDAVPVKGLSGYVLLEEEIARRAAPIAKAAGVVDVREIKYGEGTSALVADFLRSPPTGVVLAYSGGLSGMVVEALTPVASVVIRGSR